MNDLRVELVAFLRGAGRSEEHLTWLLAQPYSDTARWTAALHEIRGYRRGLARAIEKLDACSEVAA